MDRYGWNAMWSGEHDDHHHHDHDDDGVHHFDGAPDALLQALATDLPAGRALDLGCGSGDNVVWLAERGWQATGVDFAGAALELAREHAHRKGVGASFVEADVVEYQPESGLNLITLFYVHLSTEDLRRVLRGAAAALAPGGVLFFVGHDRSDPAWHGHIPPERLSTPDEVVAVLDGLDVERAEVIQHDAHRHGEAGTTVVVARKA